MPLLVLPFLSFFLCFSAPPPPDSLPHTSSPSSLCTPPHIPPPPSLQPVTLPSTHTVLPFIPHHTFHSSLPRSAFGLHLPRQCWVRLPRRHPERRMLRRFRTATASSHWDAKYTSSTTRRLSSSGSIRSVSASAAPPTHTLGFLLALSGLIVSSTASFAGFPVVSGCLRGASIAINLLFQLHRVVGQLYSGGGVLWAKHGKSDGSSVVRKVQGREVRKPLKHYIIPLD